MYYESNELRHYGVKGMKWGQRRFKNPDGSLTSAGKRRYAREEAKENYKQAYKEYNKSFNKAYGRSIGAFSPSKKHRENNKARWEDVAEKAMIADKAKADYKQAKRSDKYGSKIEKKYAKAGRNEGAAQYHRDKAAELTSNAEKRASALEKTSKRMRSEGKMVRSAVTKVAANVTRNKAADKADEHKMLGEMAANRAVKNKEKAATYATKKRVDVGKNTVASIMKSSKKTGYDNAKANDEWNEEYKKRELLGDAGYGVYNLVRDRRK